ncbi:MAG: C4-type zinc ribbon domain-containing protein [Actinomycetota bacterium]|nr:C4-type zinc ribbon domain-containing protein [Actinomycetota bacterium]
MKADPFAQLKLLDVQALDAKADKLRHQRASLPQLAEIATLSATRAELADQVRDQQIVVDDLTASQTKADADVEQVKARRTRDRDRMDQGLISNPKDLERMQHELETLERRIATLEDEELEVMEQLEDAQKTLDSLQQQVASAEERLAELTAARDQRTAEIDRELDALTAERGPAVDGMPEDLLALYEKLRANRKGIGAAELRQRRCSGCQLTIDNAEIEVIRKAPSDLVIRCEECSRILVRTSESGL